jgi:hypothetical protein
MGSSVAVDVALDDFSAAVGVRYECLYDPFLQYKVIPLDPSIALFLELLVA